MAPSLKDDIDVQEQDILEFDPELLEILLLDRTTGENIQWGTNDYDALGDDYSEDKPMLAPQITGEYTTLIQPRVSKSKLEQARRRRDKAEVFTPAWVCNKQNNLVDAAWFGRKDVFNVETDDGWQATGGQIEFPPGKTWQDYVDAPVLEISCGEAPYLVSRYSTVTGREIPIAERIGLLDRKLRVVGENATDIGEWREWAKRAFQSAYGYDLQGDNVLLARENLVLSYSDYLKDAFGEEPTVEELCDIAEVISWNIWQMDGMTNGVPNRFTVRKEDSPQISMFDLLDEDDPAEQQQKLPIDPLPAKIFDWREDREIEFDSLVKGSR